MQQRKREDQVKLQALRAQLELGVNALHRGDFDEVDGADLHGYLQSLTAADPRRSGPQLDGTTQRETSGKKRRR